MQIQVIKESMKTIVRYQEEICKYFFESLFRQHPDAKLFFGSLEFSSVSPQVILFMSRVIDSWNDQPQRSSYLETIGMNHFKQGLQPEHYEWLGEALQETLRHFFREAWNIKMSGIWMDFYEKIVSELIAGIKLARTQAISVDQAEAILSSPVLRDVIKIYLKELLLEGVQMNSSAINFNNMPGNIQEQVQEQARAILKLAIGNEMDVLLGSTSYSDQTL